MGYVDDIRWTVPTRMIKTAVQRAGNDFCSIHILQAKKTWTIAETIEENIRTAACRECKNKLCSLRELMNVIAVRLHVGRNKMAGLPHPLITHSHAVCVAKIVWITSSINALYTAQPQWWQYPINNAQKKTVSVGSPMALIPARSCGYDIEYRSGLVLRYHRTF